MIPHQHLDEEQMEVLHRATVVHVVICISRDGSETRHIFSSAEKALEFANMDRQRNHVFYDYLLDCPERHEGLTQ